MLNKLAKALLLPWRPLHAKLVGVAGFTGRGDAFFQHGGAKKLSIKLQGVAGRQAEIVLNDQLVSTLPILKGRANATFTSKHGVKLPDLGEGARIDIHQNGSLILTGVLSRN